MEIKSRLDISQLFWEVDEFCQSCEPHCSQHLQLGSGEPPVAYRSRLSLSEVTTIVIGFQGSGYRTFKEFYTRQVLPHWRSAFPNLVSDTRFVELMPWSMMVLCCFLQTRRGEVTGISFADSTPIEVCHPCRSTSHRVFKGLVGWGKNAIGWHYGFKLHLIINERGDLLAFKLTPGNVDDRKPVPEMAQGLFGKLFGDRGYISQALFEQLYQQGLELVTRYKKNMKQKLVKLMDKILLRKRSLIETVNDQLKNILQIEHSRHRSIWNFLVNLLAGLVAYTYLPTKPSLDLQYKGLKALPPAIL
ncbi:MAG: IS982 family transposase [Cyanobacteria bacterium P01_G01_bin.4]